MPFESARSLAPVTVLPSVGSTFDVVDPRAAALSTWATLDQRAGRGRLGRAWVAPAGRCLAASILVRPTSPPDAWGWLPLAVGLALAEAIDPLVPTATVSVKWPNDVLVDGAKVAGILCERRGDDVVVGVGVNLVLTPDELPTDRATSLRIAGARGEAEELADAVLAGVLRGIRDASDLADARLHERIAGRCSTLGERVRVLLPAGRDLVGTASGLGPAGELDVDVDGRRERVSAGDVQHVR
ncbi:biotin--[acetyl-CoA-carboxylase] ligase [Agrococcus sp. SGAir0287]|uniref:biotin--[acetyl-CoA-carboxylase] ligase n=1 Tax=Agrococcus sp. SGAir0287 TaxID=2070347 RepID=UPI0015861AFF|nr:biotin--[acetyl-CoA-carboxylase] ligase [Agrococcus sp. SGAir0287]